MLAFILISCDQASTEKEDVIQGWCGTCNKEIAKEYKLNEKYSDMWENGETLFKQNCASCHKIDKNSVGPKLQGAKQKWIDAGEEINYYEYIRNSEKLYKSGKSEMADKLKDFSPTAMVPLEFLTNVEIDAITFYVDAVLP